MTETERTFNFNIRFIAEVELTPGNWMKLNNAEHIKSKTHNVFKLKDEQTNEIVYVTLNLNHTETQIDEEK